VNYEIRSFADLRECADDLAIDRIFQYRLIMKKRIKFLSGKDCTFSTRIFSQLLRGCFYLLLLYNGAITYNGAIFNLTVFNRFLFLLQQNYLMKFGYLPQTDFETGNLRTEDQLRDAIKNLQVNKR